MRNVLRVRARQVYLSLDNGEPSLIIRPAGHEVKWLPRVITGVFDSPERATGTTSGFDFYASAKREKTRIKMPALPMDIRPEYKPEYLSSAWRVEANDRTHLFVLTSTTTSSKVLAKHHGAVVKGYLESIFSGHVIASSLDNGRYPITKPIASRLWRLTLDTFSEEMTALDYCSAQGNNAE